LDLTPFEEGEGLGERRGSLDERHRDRIKSVDQLIEDWEGTERAPHQEWGRIGDNSANSIKSRKVLSE
jgi:hypothetical protein